MNVDNTTIKYISVFLLCFLVFISYYTTYSLWIKAEPSGKINCKRTGTLIVTCCQDHIINRSPSNPAGTLVTYCTDCEVGPGGQDPPAPLRNCGERYIQMFEQDPNPQPPTKSPLSERISPGKIEQLQPLSQQNPNGIDESALSQHDLTEQLSSSETVESNDVTNNEHNNDFTQSTENNIEGENNSNNKEQNNNTTRAEDSSRNE